MITDFYEDIANTMKEYGIDPPKKNDLNLNEIIENDINFDEIPLDEFENILLKISSYVTFLESQKGSLEAQLYIYEEEYHRMMGLATSAGPTKKNDSLLSKDEKQAFALGHREDLMEMRKKIISLKAKVTKIKNIPFAINKKIDLLTLKYKRRIHANRN